MNSGPSRSRVRRIFRPGAAFEYNNTNYALLGLVIERVDGKPLARAMQDRLFGPLHLRNTALPASTVNPEDPGKPGGQRYGYGIAQLRWDSNVIHFHGGETPGYNSFIGHDTANQMPQVVWTNLMASLDETPTANAFMLKVLDQIYVVSSLRPS